MYLINEFNLGTKSAYPKPDPGFPIGTYIYSNYHVIENLLDFIDCNTVMTTYHTIKNKTLMK
jgi:hypothetical protein